MIKENSKINLKLTFSFMDPQNIKNAMKNNFEPTNEQITKIRLKTTGLNTMTFVNDETEYSIVDVGGQTNERKKWKNCFENVNLVLFIISLSEYDEIQFIEGTGMRMEESLTVFEDTVNGEIFKNTPFILWFNKSDELEKKLSREDRLKLLYKDYDKGQNVEEATKFIINKFMSKVKGNKDRIKLLVKNAINQSDVKETIPLIIELCKN